MNELLAWSLGSFIWGFVLWAGGGFILWADGDFIKNVFKNISGIGFFFQIIGIIFMSIPFVIAIIGISAFIITGFAKTIPVLI